MDSADVQRFWVLLDQLMTQGHFNKPSVDSILRTSLRRVHRNKFYDFYESENATAPGLILRSVELRLKKNTNDVGILIIDFREPCVTLAEIKKRHSMLAITPPTGHSADELTYYTADYASRRLSFGFPQDHAGCAVRVVVETKGEGEIH